MKHILSLLTLSIALSATPLTAQLVPVTDTATVRKLTNPVPSSKLKPVITIGDGDVLYQYVDTNSNTYTTFRADFDGNLTHAYVTQGDTTVLGWNRSDGVFNHDLEHYTGSEKNREKITRELEKGFGQLKAHFKTIALAPFSIKSERTEDAQIGDTRFTPVANWEFVGTTGFGENEKITLKCDRGANLAIVDKDSFLFPPPQSGKFRVGRKLDKLVALVERDGMWIIQATDYYGEPPAKKVANK